MIKQGREPQGAMYIPSSGVITVTQKDGKQVMEISPNQVMESKSGQQMPSSRGILDTARDRFGVRQTGSDINEESLVTAAGMEIRVKEALAAGILAKDNRGAIVEPGQTVAPHEKAAVDSSLKGQQQEVDKEKPPHDEVKAEAFDDETEALINQVNATVSPSAINAAIIANSKGEPVPDHVINEVASRAGIEPEQAREVYNRISQAFDRQALDSISATGLDPYEVFAWANKERPEDVKAAILQHACNRTTDGYKELAKDYIARMDQVYPEKIVAALPASMEPQVIKGRNGESKVILRTPHGQIDWQMACKLGYVKNVAWEG